MFVIANMIQQISVIRLLIFMFHIRYIGHTVYRLSTTTSVAVRKLIIQIGYVWQFGSNVMENNCNFES